MRRVSTIGALTVALALAVAGCTSAPPPTPRPAPPPVTGTPSSAPASPTPPPVDLSLTLTNPAGQPACGFYFSTENPGSATSYHLSLGVAVTVTGANLADVVDIDLGLNGVHTGSARFQGGTLISGMMYTPPGTALVYLTADDRMVLPGLVEAPASGTLTVTVDPANKIVETNENNNTITLRVTPTRRKNTQINDNRCTVVH
jgi:hypothetical protein